MIASGTASSTTYLRGDQTWSGITASDVGAQASDADLTEQDLNRIEDLLFEINNQLKMLENQAKKAEKYFEIKKDSKIYDHP